MNYNILDRGKLQIEIDTFHTVFLNIETGLWHVENPDRVEDPSFDDLVKANPNPEEKKKQD